MIDLRQAHSMEEARFLDLMEGWSKRIRDTVEGFLAMSEGELFPPYELLAELISDIRGDKRLPCDLVDALIEDLEKLIRTPRTAQYGFLDL